MKTDTIDHIIQDLIPSLWKREATKQSLDKVHDNEFNLKYEALMKENNAEIH